MCDSCFSFTWIIQCSLKEKVTVTVYHPNRDHQIPFQKDRPDLGIISCACHRFTFRIQILHVRHPGNEACIELANDQVGFVSPRHLACSPRFVVAIGASGAPAREGAVDVGEHVSLFWRDTTRPRVHVHDLLLSL